MKEMTLINDVSSPGSRDATADPAPTSAAAERSIGFELRRTSRLCEIDMQARLAPHGIQMGMWYYLRALWHEDGLTQSELSRRVGASGPTTQDQIRRMEGQGLVTRERSASDQRRLHVRLTPRGAALQHELLRHAADNESAILSGLAPAEAAMLRLLLERVRRSLPHRGHYSEVGEAED